MELFHFKIWRCEQLELLVVVALSWELGLWADRPNEDQPAYIMSRGIQHRMHSNDLSSTPRKCSLNDRGRTYQPGPAKGPPLTRAGRLGRCRWISEPLATLLHRRLWLECAVLYPDARLDRSNARTRNCEQPERPGGPGIHDPELAVSRRWNARLPNYLEEKGLKKFFKNSI